MNNTTLILYSRDVENILMPFTQHLEAHGDEMATPASPVDVRQVQVAWEASCSSQPLGAPS